MTTRNLLRDEFLSYPPVHAMVNFISRVSGVSFIIYTCFSRHLPKSEEELIFHFHLPLKFCTILLSVFFYFSLIKNDLYIHQCLQQFIIVYHILYCLSYIILFIIYYIVYHILYCLSYIILFSFLNVNSFIYFINYYRIAPLKRPCPYIQIYFKKGF